MLRLSGFSTLGWRKDVFDETRKTSEPKHLAKWNHISPSPRFPRNKEISLPDDYGVVSRKSNWTNDELKFRKKTARSNIFIYTSQLIHLLRFLGAIINNVSNRYLAIDDISNGDQREFAMDVFLKTPFKKVDNETMILNPLKVMFKTSQRDK